MTIRERSLSAFTTSRALVRLEGSTAGGDAWAFSSSLLPSGAPSYTVDLCILSRVH